MGRGLSVHRVGDLCTGHGTWPPRVSTGGSPDILVNGLPVHREGDPWAVHCRPGSSPDCHASVLSGGSASVKVDGLAMARAGDPVACGSKVSGVGSLDVFCGG